MSLIDKQNWHSVRILSGYLSGYSINVHPEIILILENEKYREIWEWIDKMLFAKEKPPIPSFLKPYKVSSDFPLSSYHCNQVSNVRSHHNGEYTKYSLDDRGDGVDVWVDGQLTGTFSYEDGEIKIAEVEKEILIKEGIINND